jgi:fructosyl amine oxidase (glucosone-forming)
MDRFDVVVAGCGIVGLAAAWQLVRRGLAVAAIDRARCGGSTSAGTFAWVNATSKTESEPYHRLNAAGLAAYERLAGEAGAATIGLCGGGSLQWVSAENRRLAGPLRRQFETLRGWGYAVEWLDAGAIRGRWPMLAPAADSVGLFAAPDRWVEVPRLLDWLAEDFARRGGRLFESRPLVGVGRDRAGRVASVTTPLGELETGALLLAAGTDTPELVALAAGDAALATGFPMRAVPGFLVELPRVEAAAGLDTVLWAPDEEGFHLRPTAQGGLLLGADDIDGWVGEGGNPSIIARAMAALIERARDWLPKLSPVGLEPAWRIGRRAVPADGHSLLGPIARAPGCWVATTHSGVTLALHIGRLMAEEIATGKAAAELDWFRPARFGL